MDRFVAYVSLLVSCLALAGIVAIGKTQGSVFPPEVSKWVIDQYDKNNIAVQAAKVIQNEKAKAEKAEAELKAIRAELDALKAKK